MRLRGTAAPRRTELSGILRIRAVIEKVTYKDWRLEFKLDPLRNFAPFIRWCFSANCGKSGQITGQSGRMWYLSQHMTESELVLTAFKAALTAEEHECRERFQYRGRRILNPHVSVRALWSVCENEGVRAR